MRALRQFLALTGLTLVDALRQPICLLLTTVCVVTIALVPLVRMYEFGEPGRLARNSALALHFMFGLFVAGYAASTAVSRELRLGTAAVVLSKPIRRDTFFLAKFAGVALVVLAFSLAAGAATLLSERTAAHPVAAAEGAQDVSDTLTGALLVCAPLAAYLFAALANYWFKRPFQSTAFWFLLAAVGIVVAACGLYDRNGHFAPYHLQLDLRIVPASALLTCALLALSALALALSTRLGLAPTLSICMLVLVVGLMSDYLLGRHADASRLLALVYDVVPNWQHFWAADVLGNNGRIPMGYIMHAAAYATAWTAGFLCLGVALFRRTETR